MRLLRSLVTVSIACVVTPGCSRQVQPDAYGNVEATEVVVGAEATGRILTWAVTEGQKLAAGAAVGTVDTTELALQRDQFGAQKAATASRINEIGDQIEGLRAQQAASVAQRDAARAQREALVAQHEIARRNFERTQRLFAEQAATAQQLDQAERDDRVLAQQIKAQDDQITAQDRQIAAQSRQIQAARSQQRTTTAQVASADAQVAQVDERIRRSEVRNPIAGTVLTTYARAGEFVQTGQPLYKIADLDSVDVRAFVAQPQLALIRLGQEVQVSFDAGHNIRRSLPGTVTWVSSQAEFTPTPIQTRDERATLVYAVKIRVSNQDNLLKIGMPVDVKFGDSGRR